MVFAACGSEDATDAGTTTSCSQSVEDNCSLEAANHGNSDGTCETGYVGSCSYTCNEGKWEPTTNATGMCVAGEGCMIEEPTNANCRLPQSHHDESVSGACAAGYVGSCSYTCSDGKWEPTTDATDMCVIGQVCPSETNTYCDLTQANHDDSVTGTCVSGYLGSCRFTCNDGKWEATEDVCLSDTDGDSIADLNDLCMNSQNAGFFTSNSSNDIDGDGCEDAEEDVDDDGDGLIEIRTEIMLKDIRHNLIGTGYKAGATATNNLKGCGGDNDPDGDSNTNDSITECSGYELVPDGGGDTLMLTESWTPIVGDFVATFDGNGNTIARLTIAGTVTGDNTEILGFFTYIGSGGIVRNLTIQEVNITGTATASDSRTGSLAGVSNGQIDEVKIINTDQASTGISVASDQVGGLVGRSNSSIMNSYSTISVTGSANVGGLIGMNDSTITNSYSTGVVTGSGKHVGGLVGWNTDSITNSYSTGSVTNLESLFGGFTGGLVGFSRGSIINSYSTGDLNSTTNVGGLVGQSSGIITNSYSTGTVTGSGNLIGGLAGRSNASITNSYSTGTVINTNMILFGGGFTGGLVGWNTDSITNSYATGSVNSSSSAVGGLVGLNNGIITNSYVTGSTVTGNSSVGGLVGSNTKTITNSFVHDSFTGDRLVGSIETPIGVTEKALIGLTSISGWSNNDWAFEADKFPTLKSNTGIYPILCGQNGDHNEDGVIDWVDPPESCP